MKNTYVIGDIHGAYKAITQLIEKINPKKEDRLIFLGDYVDGWSQSSAVVAYLMQLDEQYECIFIKGNHDTWCRDWLADGTANAIWLKHGGAATVASYEPLDAAEKARHLQFFDRLRNYYIDGHNRLFIHAGFASMHGPEQERYESNYQWDRTLWEMALAMDKRIQKDSKLYPKRLLLYNEIFIGHTPTLNYDVTLPMNGCNVWNVDTGAAFYGKLSAINADTKDIYQSEVVRNLYPSETGRNKD